LAEWTGLEPATPGVTGPWQKSMVARVSACFDIPKITALRVILWGVGVF